MVNKLQEHRKPSAFPSQNKNLCNNCGWEGDGSDMPYKGKSTTLCCPTCGGIVFTEVLKLEYAKLPPINKKTPFEGERKHIKSGPWRIY